MYLQITNRCNMECAHCALSCTSEGIDMGMSTFKKFVDVAYEIDHNVTIGGGEPTLHPKFWEMLGYSIGKVDQVTVITNGKRTQDALSLLRLSQNSEVLSAYVSLDSYHELIDERVENLARALKKKFGSSDDPAKIVRMGRASNWGEATHCICEDIDITPEGKIYQCGCREVQIKNVSALKKYVMSNEVSCSRAGNILTLREEYAARS